MIRVVIRWVMNAVALYIVAKILPGVHMSNFNSALIAVLIIGLVNALIKPLIFLLTLPVTILTLGLFSFIINALMFMLASAIAPGFKIDGFGTALLASILYSVITAILHSLVK